MSYADALAKLRWYQMRGMESPLNSPERTTWIEIMRELEVLVRKMTTGATVAIKEESFDIIPWE